MLRRPLTVRNQGPAPAPASTADVASGDDTVTVDVGTLAPGVSRTVPVAIPLGCFDADCDFTIIVDSDDEIVEENEGNNVGNGSCIG